MCEEFYSNIGGICDESRSNFTKSNKWENMSHDSSFRTVYDAREKLLLDEQAKLAHAGKVAVAKVVLNRTNANGFPNTITGVIYEPIKNGYAFTPVTDGRINQPATQEAKMAVEEALTSKGTNSDWLYFYNPKTSTDKWITTRQTVAQIGNHLFAK